MIDFFWLFVGILTGLLITSVFIPPPRKINGLPMPNAENVFHTDVGCVKFITKEVECGPNATSLNLVASQNK